jgi:PAS domain S-box-containing protein
MKKITDIRNCTIMVVDDNSANVNLLDKILNLRGYNVRAFTNSQFALQSVFSNPPDLVLLDIKMPDLDGFAFCRKLKENPETSDVPVIFISALQKIEGKVTAFNAGGVDYITKPFQESEVLARVETHLSLQTMRRDLEQLLEEQSSKLSSKEVQLREETFEREKAYEALDVSQKKYQEIFNATRDGIIIYDAETETIIEANPAVLEMTGYSYNEILRFRAGDLSSGVTPFNSEEFRRLFRQTIADAPRNFKREWQSRRKNGEMLWIEITLTYSMIGGQPVVVAVGRDIAERKQAEIAFQTLVESTVGHLGQGLFDTIVKKVSELFRCECVILGELINRTTVRALSMQLDNKVVKDYSYRLTGTPCENVFKQGYVVCSENVTELFPDDKELTDMKAQGYVGIPVGRKDEGPIGILCAISRNKLNLPRRAEDIMNVLQTRAGAEIERRRAEEKLRQAQKMESIGTLAGGIAHDFNNILFPLLGFAEMLKEDIPSDSPLQDYIDEILRAALRSKDLVKQILAFSRQGDQNAKPIKLQPIVKEALKLVRSSIPTTIDIQLDIDSGCGVVIADPTQIHQIVMNLATNAYHAMEGTGGRLKVTLKQTLLESGQSVFPELIPGEYAHLSVADTGVGIETGVMDKIFDPYFTTKETGKGTGLGLSVVQGIVKSCNGDICINSEPGKGTEIQVYLPIMDRKIDDKRPAPSEPTQGGHEKILLVDDEEAIVRMEQQMLERQGYRITTCMGSVEALEAFKVNPASFDLLITDMTMPTMTGVQLAGAIKNIRPNMPIILCTGFSYQVNDEESKALGIKGFLMKPVVKSVMAKMVRKVLDEAKV